MMMMVSVSIGWEAESLLHKDGTIFRFELQKLHYIQLVVVVVVVVVIPDAVGGKRSIQIDDHLFNFVRALWYHAQCDDIVHNVTI